MLRNALCLFVAATLALVIFIPSYRQMQGLRQKNRDYAAQIVQLNKERSQLIEEKQRLENDPAYLEKVAREQMHLIRKGEVIYKIVPANAETSNTEKE